MTGEQRRLRKQGSEPAGVVHITKASQSKERLEIGHNPARLSKAQRKKKTRQARELLEKIRKDKEEQASSMMEDVQNRMDVDD